MRRVLIMMLVLILIATLAGCQKEIGGLAFHWDSNNLTVTVDDLSDNSSSHVFKDQNSLQAFQTIFSAAIKKDSIVNLTSPEYIVNINSNEQDAKIYVWVGKKGQQSTLMKEDDTHTIYIVSEKMTDNLSQLVMF